MTIGSRSMLSTKLIVEVSATPELSAQVALRADHRARATTQNMRLAGIRPTAARVLAVPTRRCAYQDANRSRPATLMKLVAPLEELLSTSRKDRMVKRTSPAVTSEIVTRLKAMPIAPATPSEGLIPAASPTAADIASSSAAQPAYSPLARMSAGPRA